MKNQFKLFSANLKGYKTKMLVLFLFVALCSFTSFAQQRTITGTILDETGLPLPGATVIENGTANGTITNFDGKYSIDVLDGGSLTFSFIGYKSVTMAVGTQTNIDLTLNPDLQKLDEVVVVGYGTMKKKDLTGSVASVKMEKLTEAPVANFDQALAGRVTGVQVNSRSGEPGAGMDITIRGGNTVNGDNSPLYVIDGFIIEGFNAGLLNTG